MPSFRCSSGHQVALAFGDEHVRLPCSTCGVDVYKFRDAVIEDDAPVAASTSGEPAAGSERPSLSLTQVRVAIAGAVFAIGAAWFAWRQPAASPAAAGHGPVIPIAAAPKAVSANPSAVSITHFSAVPTDAGVVKVSFRLANAGGAANDYPGLAVHWHGVPDADQLIGKDSYAHPSLPFTTADVALELARPKGATGIDVKITY